MPTSLTLNDGKCSINHRALLDSMIEFIACRYLKWQLLPGGNFYRVATFSRWQLFPGGNFFRVATFSRWQLFPGGNFFQVATFSRWQLFPGGNFFHVATFSRWQLFPGGNFYRKTIPLLNFAKPNIESLIIVHDLKL